MSDVLSLGTHLTKRVISRDSSMTLVDLVNPSFRIYKWADDTETLVTDDISYVNHASVGTYYIEVYLDPALFEDKETYHVVLQGIAPGATVSIEVFSYSFVAEKSSSTLIVEFG